MEKKVLGVVLTIAGIIGLIAAACYVLNTGPNGIRDIKLISIYGVLGIIFFFAGISLVRTTKDKS